MRCSMKSVLQCVNYLSSLREGKLESVEITLIRSLVLALMDPGVIPNICTDGSNSIPVASIPIEALLICSRYTGSYCYVKWNITKHICTSYLPPTSLTYHLLRENKDERNRHDSDAFRNPKERQRERWRERDSDIAFQKAISSLGNKHLGLCGALPLSKTLHLLVIFKMA